MPLAGGHLWLVLLLVLLIVLIIYGPGKMGDIGGALGKSVRDFGHALRGQTNPDQLPPVARDAADSTEKTPADGAGSRAT